MERNELLISIYGTHLVSKIEALIIEDARRVRTLKDMAEFVARYSYYFLYNSSINTIKSRSLALRKLLESTGKDYLIDAFKLPTEIFSTLIKNNDEKVTEQYNNEREIDIISLADIINARLTKLINTNDPLQNFGYNVSNNSTDTREKVYMKMILVALSTGRRQFEILSTLSVSKKKNEVEYIGLAKKKENDARVIAPSLYLDAKEIRQYLNDIRTEFKITGNETSKQLNSRFNGICKNALVKFVPELKNESFHFLRSVYAEVCYEKFGKGADKVEYCSNVLGHAYKVLPIHAYITK